MANKIFLTPSQKRMDVVRKDIQGKEITQIQNEIGIFNKDLNYDNYQEKYNRLSANAKTNVKTPEEIFSTSEYKTYKSASEYKAAYDQVMKHYHRGMLWAVAAYGEGLEQQIARKLIKEGYAPSESALNKEYEQRVAVIKAVRAGDIPNVEIRGNTIFDTQTSKPIGISKILDKKENIQAINDRNIQKISTINGVRFITIKDPNTGIPLTYSQSTYDTLKVSNLLPSQKNYQAIVAAQKTGDVNIQSITNARIISSLDKRAIEAEILQPNNEKVKLIVVPEGQSFKDFINTKGESVQNFLEGENIKTVTKDAVGNFVDETGNIVKSSYQKSNLKIEKFYDKGEDTRNFYNNLLSGGLSNVENIRQTSFKNIGTIYSKIFDAIGKSLKGVKDAGVYASNNTLDYLIRKYGDKAVIKEDGALHLQNGSIIRKDVVVADLTRNTLDKVNVNQLENTLRNLRSKMNGSSENVSQIIDNSSKGSSFVLSSLTKGIADDLFDLINIGSLVSYEILAPSTLADKTAIATMVWNSLKSSPATYGKYMKENPIEGTLFTVGSIIGMWGALGKLSKASKFKTIDFSAFDSALKKVEGIASFNLKTLVKELGKESVQKLYNADKKLFAEIVSGLKGNEYFDIKLKSLSDKDIKLLNKVEFKDIELTKGQQKILNEFSKNKISTGLGIAKEKFKKMFEKFDIGDKELTILDEWGERTGIVKDGDITVSKVDTSKGFTEVRLMAKDMSWIEYGKVFNDGHFYGSIKKKVGDKFFYEKYKSIGNDKVLREYYDAANNKLFDIVTNEKKNTVFILGKKVDISLKAFKKISRTNDILMMYTNKIRQNILMTNKQGINMKRFVNNRGKNLIDITPTKVVNQFIIKHIDGTEIKVTMHELKRAILSNDKSTEAMAVREWFMKKKIDYTAKGFFEEVVQTINIVSPKIHNFENIVKKNDYFIERLSPKDASKKILSEKRTKQVNKVKDALKAINEAWDDLNSLKNHPRVTFMLANPSAIPIQSLKLATDKIIDRMKTNLSDVGYSLKDLDDLISNKIFDMLNRPEIKFNYFELMGWKDYIIFLSKANVITEYKANSIVAQINRQIDVTKSKQNLKLEDVKLSRLDQVLQRTPSTTRKEIDLKLPRIEMPTEIKTPDLKLVLGNSLPVVAESVDRDRRGFIVLEKSDGSWKRYEGIFSGRDARLFGMNKADENPSRTIRLLPSSKPINRKYTGADVSYKFRNYRIQNKKEVRPSEYRFIEKRKYFNDRERLGR